MKYDSLFETRVFNGVNETNLEYISIVGLFDRYNIEIPFDKQVNIFIGENGLGKTTILNCIYYVLEKKFSKLADIQFSEIKIKFRSDSKIQFQKIIHAVYMWRGISSRPCAPYIGRHENKHWTIGVFGPAFARTIRTRLLGE